MNLKDINLRLEVGQKIIVGPNNKRAEITKIEFHEKSGSLCINTTHGPRQALTFKLCTDIDKHENKADKFR